MTDVEVGRAIFNAQDKWLEHYKFGKGDVHMYRLQNADRSKLQEHAMDAVRELSRSKGGGYVGEKIGRIERYLDGYDEYSSDWGEFSFVTKKDREILKELVRLENEKVRPLYSQIREPYLRKAIVNGMNFVNLVSDPNVTKEELRRSFSVFKHGTDEYYDQREIRRQSNIKKLKGKLVLHRLKNVKTFDREVLVTEKRIEEKVLRERLKKGWIPTKIFNENEKTILEWDRLKERLVDARGRVKTTEEDIKDSREAIDSLKNNPIFKAYPPERLAFYEERLEEAMNKIEGRRRDLKDTQNEIRPLNKKIKGMRNYTTLKARGYI